MQACVLGDLAAGRTRGTTVYEDRWVVVLVDRTGGHGRRLLVLPKVHASEFQALSASLQSHLFKISKRAQQSLGVAGVSAPPAQPEVAGMLEHVHLRVA